MPASVLGSYTKPSDFMSTKLQVYKANNLYQLHYQYSVAVVQDE